MESATLTRAHEHVRNAATATYGNSIATAGQEHESAASAFREAAKDTANSEALRILSLLEDHHRKLAGLIKEPPRKEKQKKKESATVSDASSTASSSTKPSTARTASPPSSSSSSSPRAPSRRRLPQSSIATNLAEKRGIPGVRRSTPSATPVSVTNAIASRNESAATPVRDMLERQSRKAEEEKRRNSPQTSLQEEKVTAQPTSPSTEDNFKRFYSAFGGVISAISAPLAFTSLPLSPAPPTPAADPPLKKEAKSSKSSRPSSRNQSPEASRTVKSSEPDLAALISKPALRALQETNTPHFANPNESFYLVPTSGGTVSYANILRDPNLPNIPPSLLPNHGHVHHAARDPNLDPITENDNEASGGGSSTLRTSSHEEFVDARETVLPPSPNSLRSQAFNRPNSRGGGKSSVAQARTLAAGRGAGQKTVEEYELQIETLLQTVDKQAKRIAMWETSSQSSHIALAQSFRARSIASDRDHPSTLAHALSLGTNVAPSLPSPPIQTTNNPSPTTAATLQDAEVQKRIAALEAQLHSQSQQISALTTEKDQLTRQNEKNALVLNRYREQWEKLKAGARKKQLERTEKRVQEMKAGAGSSRVDSDSGPGAVDDDVEGDGDGDKRPEIGDEVVEEPGFGKA